MAWAESGGSNRRRSDAGFSFVETILAILLLTVVSLGVAQLFAIGTQANSRAKAQTSTALLAVQKMEQLRGLTWGFDAEGFPVSDTTSRLDTPVAAGGGPGLNPSPANTLTQDTPGYVDYLDIHGDYLGPNRPAGATFCRRWAVDPLPTNPNNTLVLQVRVIPVGQLDAVDAVGGRALEETRLVSVKTRKAP